MSKTLNQGTGRACGTVDGRSTYACGKAFGSPFACPSDCCVTGCTRSAAFKSLDANEARSEVARRYEQEAVALTARLEQAEDEVERLHVQNARLQKLVGENPLFDEHKRVMEENARLLDSLHEEQRQRRMVNQALFPGVLMTASIDDTVEEIERLRDAERQQMVDDQPSLDIVARERPEDLPVGYAFKVAAYVLDRAAELEE